MNPTTAQEKTRNTITTADGTEIGDEAFRKQVMETVFVGA